MKGKHKKPLENYFKEKCRTLNKSHFLYNYINTKQLKRGLVGCLLILFLVPPGPSPQLVYISQTPLQLDAATWLSSGPCNEGKSNLLHFQIQPRKPACGILCSLCLSLSTGWMDRILRMCHKTKVTRSPNNPTEACPLSRYICFGLWGGKDSICIIWSYWDMVVGLTQQLVFPIVHTMIM